MSVNGAMVENCKKLKIRFTDTFDYAHSCGIVLSYWWQDPQPNFALSWENKSGGARVHTHTHTDEKVPFSLNIPLQCDDVPVVPAEPCCHAEVIRASSVLSAHIIAAVQ